MFRDVLAVSKQKHPDDMTREELITLVFAMSWAALDLAQHLYFTTKMLKEEYRKEAYKKATRMAYELVFLWEVEPDENKNSGILIFGKNGLEHG